MSRLIAMTAAVSMIAACASGSAPAATSIATTTSPRPTPSAAVTASAMPTATPEPLATSASGFPLYAFGDIPDASLDDATAARLRSVLESAIDGLDTRGVTAAVIVGGVGTWTDTVGRDASGNAVSEATVWQTGSIAKTVVAAQVLRLVDGGRLFLDDKAADRIRATPPPNTNGATISDLLRMRSGLSTNSAPGTTWHYSNGDYVLLGQVIEGVEGRPLGAVLTADILAVPGADGLRFPANGTVANAAGPLDSDAISLARWGYAVYGGQLLNPKALALMLDFDENTYGMGTFDFSTDYGEPAAGHLGESGSWSAALVVFPSRQTVLAVLSNSSSWEWTYTVTRQLEAAL